MNARHELNYLEKANERNRKITKTRGDREHSSTNKYENYNEKRYGANSVALVT